MTNGRNSKQHDGNCPCADCVRKYGAPIPVCQHCEQPVHWAAKPADATYAAFTHDSTNRTACS